MLFRSDRRLLTACFGVFCLFTLYVELWCLCVCVCVYIHVFMGVCICMCVCVVCVYDSVCVCVCAMGQEARSSISPPAACVPRHALPPSTAQRGVCVCVSLCGELLWRRVCACGSLRMCVCVCIIVCLCAHTCDRHQVVTGPDGVTVKPSS